MSYISCICNVLWLLFSSNERHEVVFSLCKNLLFLNPYAPVSKANWHNMTFTAGNLFPSLSYIGVTRVNLPLGFELRSPAWELDDLLTELSLPLNILNLVLVFLFSFSLWRCYPSMCKAQLGLVLWLEGKGFWHNTLLY